MRSWGGNGGNYHKCKVLLVIVNCNETFESALLPVVIDSFDRIHVP